MLDDISGDGEVLNDTLCEGWQNTIQPNNFINKEKSIHMAFMYKIIREY